MSPANTIDIDWDKDSDTLYVARKNAPKKTVNIDLAPGVVKRVDAKTNEVVGLIIHNFSHQRKATGKEDISEWPLMEAFDRFFDVLNSAGRVHH